MSRKRRAPKKIPVVDPKYKSVIIPKLINSIMHDGKKITAEKIVYDALDKLKSKSKDEPFKIFNDAINNIKPQISSTNKVGEVAPHNYDLIAHPPSTYAQEKLKYLCDFREH